jgi:dienelactone hydrolase
MFEGMDAVEVEHGGTTLCGYAARPARDGPLPAVLVMHSALGVAHGVNEPVARKLAAEGYLAICTDMYGAHLEGAGIEDAGLAYAKNLADPDQQRERTVAWFESVAGRPDVDASRVAAIGFCYGGHTVLELARSGADVKAAVSYHGILTTHRPAEPGTINGRVVAYCGANDPYAPLADVDALRAELERAGARYQITTFGTVGHGFTDPEAARLGLEGVGYDELADHLSWNGTLVLLRHVFGG